MRIWGFVFVVILIFNTFRGWFMDRFGWVWPMRWFGCAVLAAGSAAFYYSPQWFGANALMMIVASVIVGIGTCAFSSLPTIMTLYAGGKQGAALSAYNLAAGLTTFAGPGIATIPLPIVGYEGVCWTYAGLYVHPAHPAAAAWLRRQRAPYQGCRGSDGNRVTTIPASINY